MASPSATIDVTLGFMPAALAMDDPDHPGLLRAGPRASAPYDDTGVERHLCPATDTCADGATRPDLLEFGFDTVDLSGLATLQAAFARIREAGQVSDDDAATVRRELRGAVLPTLSGRRLEVLYLADEGFIMRQGGPNGLSVVGQRSTGVNGHGVATSVHADQDVYGTPLAQIMDGRAPELFRHHSPDGDNHDAALMLVNLWVPLQQITQPLTLGDGRSIDRRRHQLRYGLATQSFLERDDDMVINDIWTFLHGPDQQWYLRSEMDHRRAYVFDTLSTPHGACTLPGEEVAERCYRELAGAEVAVEAGDAGALSNAVSNEAPAPPATTPPALREAIDAMATVAADARRDPTGVCGPRAGEWLAASRSARRRVIRMSLELRMVVSVAGS